LTNQFFEAVEMDDTLQPTDESLRKALNLGPNNPPIMFNLVTARDFLTWIVSLVKKDGTSPGYSTFNSHRAAFFNLFRDFGVTMSKTLEFELRNHFKGLKRRVASRVTNGDGKCKTGKDPLSFGMYRCLALAMLQSQSREFVFARTFMILCWNLMSRAGNVLTICHDHMEFYEDSLCIYFAQMKCKRISLTHTLFINCISYYDSYVEMFIKYVDESVP
jgi:hypothetical protein